MSRAPWLVLAVGNPSRGDDALGPALLERLRNAGIDIAGEVELLAEFQLQVEHALDLEGRRSVLFVDAARPGAADGATLAPICADARLEPITHALRAQSLLRVATQLAGRAPPAWLLAIEGESFALGEGLSAPARRNLECAVEVALDWLRAQRAAVATQDCKDQPNWPVLTHPSEISDHQSTARPLST